jgi:hypothetical protein
MLRIIGKIYLKVCNQKNIKEKPNNKKELNIKELNNKEELDNKISIKFNINNYINNLLTDPNIYNHFKGIYITKEKILNYTIKLKIKNNKINYIEMILKYDLLLITLGYRVVPHNFFDAPYLVKLETYLVDNNNINNKIIEKNIYYSSNKLITYNIIEFLIKINKNMFLNNLESYIEIYENYVLFY